MKFLNIHLTVLLLLLSYCLFEGIFSSASMAAGYELPQSVDTTAIGNPTGLLPACSTDSPEHSDNAAPDANAVPRCRPSLQLLNWNRWSQPAAQGEMLCREQSGNLICLSPEEAARLHW